MWEQIVTCSAAREVAFCIPWFGGTTLPIFWYGILASIGIFTGAFYAAKHIDKEGQDPEIVWDALLWVLIAALIGARLWYVLAEVLGGSTAYSFSDPLNIINPRNGGMNIFGGVIFAMVAVYFYARAKKHDFWLIADAGTMGLLIGQAIGRIGNFVNQELYGPPTGIEWFGMHISPERRQMFPQWATLPPETRFHPTMIYEMIWLLVSFGVLYYLFRRFQDRIVHGVLTGAYLILAGFGRFIMEFWRPDQPTFEPMPGFPISYSRVLAMLYVVIGIVVLLDRMGYLRIPFIPRPQTRKQRLAAFQEILTQRRRHERASERERVREQRRKDREQRAAAAAAANNTTDSTTTTGESSS
jgi:phosphatidylglycerol---prolipoprotein diacylglyceryl transferase